MKCAVCRQDVEERFRTTMIESSRAAGMAFMAV